MNISYSISWFVSDTLASLTRSNIEIFVSVLMFEHRTSTANNVCPLVNSLTVSVGPLEVTVMSPHSVRGPHLAFIWGSSGQVPVPAATFHSVSGLWYSVSVKDHKPALE